MTEANTLGESLSQILAEGGAMADGLAAFADDLRRLAPNYAAATDALVERLNSNGVGAGAPQVGDAMPNFVLPDSEGRIRQLSEFTERGPTIVSINRGHWCPFCAIELASLAQLHAAIQEQGVGFVSIMPDLQVYTRRVTARGVPFPVLSDIDCGYALALGLTFWMGDDLMDLLLNQFGRDLSLYHGGGGWFLPIPATFLVGQDQKVLARYVDPDFRTNRMSIEDIRAALGR